MPLSVLFISINMRSLVSYLYYCPSCYHADSGEKSCVPQCV